MKQLQVPISDELMKAAKMYAFQNGTTLKAVVSAALEMFLGHEIAKEEPAETPEEPKKETPKQPQPKKEEETSLNQFYTLRKTAKVGKPRTEMFQHNYKGVTWMGMEGCRDHFDADGNLIPFRFTGDNGVVYDPDEEELQELATTLGMPVVVEK